MEKPAKRNLFDDDDDDEEEENQEYTKPQPE